MAFRVSREEFEHLLEEAIERVPKDYSEYLENITIMVEDYPSREERNTLTSGKNLLLGLFSGVPYPGKGSFFEIPRPLPDRIILLQRNIETICNTEDELVSQILATLVHELLSLFRSFRKGLEKIPGITPIVIVIEKLIEKSLECSLQSS